MGGWWAYRVRRCTVPLVGSVVLSGSCVLGAAASPAPVPTPAAPVAVAVAVVPPAGPVDAVRVLQMNLCDSGAARCYTGRSIAEATEVIRGERPQVVTLNEVCRDDVATLERAMAGTGGGGTVVAAFRAAQDRRTGGDVRCRNGQAYGIGLVARLGPAPHGYRTDGGVFPVQDLRSPEGRAWLCVSPEKGVSTRSTEAATGAAAVAVCTTHLANGSPAVARAQCGYLLGTAIPAVRRAAGSVPVVLGGDLNMTSGGLGQGDLGSCVPVGDRHTDDGVVQHVVASPEFALGARRTIGLTTTDHPGLLVTLTLAPPHGP